MGAVKLAKNVDIDKHKYSGYGTEFDARGNFLYPNDTFGQNVIILGVNMCSSVHANNKKYNLFVLGESITQGIYDRVSN